MTPIEPDREQRVLDARMEYSLLATNLVTLANMFWVGYGAFFTINTLLATALGVSYSDAASRAVDSIALKAVHIMLPIIGVFISVVAITTAISIVKMQRIVAKRGREIETLLCAKTFERVVPFARPFPIATVIGSTLFGIIWLALLYGTPR